MQLKVTTVTRIATRLALCVVIGGGATTARAQHSAPAILPDHPKLDIDPTEKVAITGWWMNGTEIVLVREDGAFSWWDQPNRFRTPSKTGRWDRQNYRTFWLDPYIDRKNPSAKPARLRGAMRRADGVITVTFESYAPFRLCDAPPAAPEDSYVGMWTGPGGTLDLRPDGTYALVSRAGQSDDAPPITRAGHGGAWSYDGKYIILRATGTTKDPVICTVVDRRSEGVSEGVSKASPSVEALTTPVGELRRVAPVKPPAAPAAKADPVAATAAKAVPAP